MFKGFGKGSKQDITPHCQDEKNEAGQENQGIAKEGTQRGECPLYIPWWGQPS